MNLDIFENKKQRGKTFKALVALLDVIETRHKDCKPECDDIKRLFNKKSIVPYKTKTPTGEKPKYGPAKKEFPETEWKGIIEKIDIEGKSLHKASMELGWSDNKGARVYKYGQNKIIELMEADDEKKYS